MNTTDIILKISPSFIRKKIEGRKELKKIIDNINWLTFEKFFCLGLGVLVSAYIARYLGPEKYGIINYAIAFVALFSVLYTLGLDNIIVRNIVNHPKKQDEYLGTTIFLKSFGSLCLLIIVFLGLLIIRPDDLIIQLFVVIIAVGTVFKSFETIDFWFQSIVQQKYTVYSRLISFIIINFLRILFVITQAPLIAFIMVISLEAIITGIGLIFFYHIKSPLRITKWKTNLSIGKELLKDSWPLILSGVSVAIYMKIDQVMIGSMINDKALGIYSAAVRLSESWYFIPIFITGSVFPTIIRSRRKNRKLYFKRLQNLFDMLTWSSILITIIIAFLSKFIVNLIFGSEFEESSIILTIHIFSGIFVSLGIVSSKYIVIENITKILLFRTAFAGILNVILNLILIPLIGITGAAIATLVSYFSANLTIIFFKETRILIPVILKSFNFLRIREYLK